MGNGKRAGIVQLNLRGWEINEEMEKGKRKEEKIEKIRKEEI